MQWRSLPKSNNVGAITIPAGWWPGSVVGPQILHALAESVVVQQVTAPVISGRPEQHLVVTIAQQIVEVQWTHQIHSHRSELPGQCAHATLGITINPQLAGKFLRPIALFKCIP